MLSRVLVTDNFAVINHIQRIVMLPARRPRQCLVFTETFLPYMYREIEEGITAPIIVHNRPMVRTHPKRHIQDSITALP
jgi:hypothetical protein